MTTREDIGSKLRQIVLAVLREESGEGAIAHEDLDGNRVPTPESWAVLTYPTAADPLEALKVARAIADHGRGMVRDYALKARGAGRTWAEIAGPLGVAAEADDRAQEAFLFVVGPRYRFDPQYAYWRCISCGERVRDSGPYGGHPDDSETGHTETCERHTAAVAAYESEMG